MTMAVNMHGICAKTQIRDESPQNGAALKRYCRLKRLWVYLTRYLYTATNLLATYVHLQHS